MKSARINALGEAELVEEIMWQDDETGAICTKQDMEEEQEELQVQNVTLSAAQIQNGEIRLDQYENAELQSFPPTI